MIERVVRRKIVYYDQLHLLQYLYNCRIIILPSKFYYVASSKVATGVVRRYNQIMIPIRFDSVRFQLLSPSLDSIRFDSTGQH
jgi:hypothetical protein